MRAGRSPPPPGAFRLRSAVAVLWCAPGRIRTCATASGGRGPTRALQGPDLVFRVSAAVRRPRIGRAFGVGVAMMQARSHLPPAYVSRSHGSGAPPSSIRQGHSRAPPSRTSATNGPRPSTLPASRSNAAPDPLLAPGTIRTNRNPRSR